jgi:transposase-like protein
MSPKKITDADKLEIVDLYRQSGETTASLAVRYGVSNSTISRLLKTSIPEDEYELLIQQKRGSKAGSEEDSLVATAGAEEPSDEPIMTAPVASVTALESNLGEAGLAEDDIQLPAIVAETSIELQEIQSSQPQENFFDIESKTVATATQRDRDFEDKSPPQATVAVRQSTQPPTASMTEEQSASKRLVRRRSSARLDDPTPALVNAEIGSTTDFDRSELENLARVSTPATLPTSDSLDPTIEIAPSALKRMRTRSPQMPVLREVAGDRDDYFTESVAPTPITAPRVLAETSGIERDNTGSKLFEDEVEEDVEDVNALAAMFGEEIAEGDDDEDDEDDDWEEESVSIDGSRDRDLLLTGDRSHIQVTPLSQATLPRTCYIVIDKFAELIVRPLKDFAELGQIPGEEIQQRTLPIFDNHRVAKRFSNQRTQRVIKVPDSRVFQKTIGHLRSKGIARLLVDGNIYSLN